MDMFSQPMPLVMQVGRMVDGLSLVTHQQIHLHNLFELQIIKILFSGETTFRLSGASGNLITTSDAKINGITVGRGNGNIATNTTLGNQALNTNTTGINNIAIGKSSLFLNTTGQYNIAIGNSALYNNTNGRYNFAIGNEALTMNVS